MYARLAPFYDFIYGATLEHGRRRATRQLAPQPGDSILEVGIGTALSRRIVLLNHFDLVSASRVDRLVGQMARFVSGVDWNLDRHAFLREVDLVAISTESVNLRVSSFVVCRTP